MRTLKTDNSILTKDRKKSYLTEDKAAGVSALTIDSIVGFDINKIILIGEVGDEKSEIIKTHNSTSPSGSTVTLLTATQFEHPAGTPVYVIDWDQIQILHASTVDGVKTSLVTQSIQVDQMFTVYDDTSQTAGFYFVRLKETISNTFSDYSDPIPFGGYADYTVGKAIQYALKRNKIKVFTDFIDHDFCMEESNNCLKDARRQLKRWPSMQEFDYELATTERGVNEITLPSSVYQYSNQPFLQIRVRQASPLIYKDKKEFDAAMEGVRVTTLSALALVGATSITLVNASDFEDEGTINIGGQQITYTGKSTNTLTGIPSSGTGAITSALASGDVVWQNETEGTPEIFTIYEGKMRFWPLVDDELAGRVVLADFWKEATEVNSDNDTLSITGYDMVKYWLTARIRAMLTNDGMLDTEDGDFQMYLRTLRDSMKKEASSGQKFKWNIQLNTMPFRNAGWKNRYRNNAN